MTPLVCSQTSKKKIMHLHGVFMEIDDKGVLLQGKSGVGKTECALALMERGHRLIADDIISFSQKRQAVFGKAPKLLEGFISIREIGVLDVKKIYDTHSLVKERKLDLIISLISAPNLVHDVPDTSWEFMGKLFPLYSLTCLPNRNIPLLIELAVKKHLQREKGEDPSAQFYHQQKMAIERSLDIG